MRSTNIRELCRGFSIVEALVALVVLCIGMLGIAALYVESLRAGRSAVYRTQAVNLAADMADRIRSNRTAGDAYVLEIGDAPATAGCVGDGAVDCAPAVLAGDDMARWLESIGAQLPGNAARQTPYGTISVAPAAPPTRQYTIQVTWSEPGEDQDFSYVLNLQI